MKNFDSFASTRGNKTEPRKEVRTVVNTHIATQIDPIEIDSFALGVMEITMPTWVPKRLQKKMKESLCGYSKWAALWIAESLTDACRGRALATTGIAHIDDMLWKLYAEILKSARNQGVNIANHC